MNRQDEDIPELAVTGMGGVTPVGLDAMSSSLAIFAGISRLATLDEFPPEAYWDEDYVALRAVGASATEVTAGLLGLGRYVRLAAPALAEALLQANVEVGKMPAIGLIQVLPSPLRPGRDDRLETLMPRRLERSCGIQKNHLEPRFVNQGNAGTIAALALASKMVETRTEAVVVGCVDSLVEPKTLLWLDHKQRLKTAERRDGLFPGEAAAYFVVENWDRAIEQDKQILAGVSGMSFAEETKTVWQDQACVGDGLTEAIRQTIEPLGDAAAEIGIVVADLNGERYRALEWSYTEMKAFADFDVERNLWHAADCIGDTGCATGGVSLVLAIAALQTGFADTDKILISSSDDDGHRASAIVTRAMQTNNKTT